MEYLDRHFHGEVASVRDGIGVVHFAHMNKHDLNQIKSTINLAFETHFARVHEEITDARNEFAPAEKRLAARIDRFDEKLGTFENNEVDKRQQLEVRITHA